MFLIFELNMKMTKQTLEHLQQILKNHGYTVRYERGQFQGGYCLVLQKHMVMINKFHSLDGKIHALAEVIQQIEIDREKLTPTQEKLVGKLKGLTN